MDTFLSTIIAACIGAMIAPSFSTYINSKISKKQKQYDYLDKIYKLAKELELYILSFPTQVTFLILFKQNKISQENMPKYTLGPFSELCYLLDYCLNLDEDFVGRLNEVSNLISTSMRSYAYSINDSKAEGDHFSQSLKIAIKVAEKGYNLSEDIVKYTKCAKTQLDSELSIFDRKFWTKLFCCLYQRIKSLKKNPSIDSHS